jgi:hypothetical protein
LLQIIFAFGVWGVGLTSAFNGCASLNKVSLQRAIEEYRKIQEQMLEKELEDRKRKELDAVAGKKNVQVSFLDGIFAPTSKSQLAPRCKVGA